MTQSEENFVVKGQVLRNEKPLAQIKVQAYHEQFQSVILLGEAQTDIQGFYTITYQKPENESQINLFVCVGSKEDPLATSLVKYQAKSYETINVTAPSIKEKSDWEQLDSTLLPLINGLQPNDLTEKQVKYLAGITSRSVHEITEWVNAYQLHSKHEEVSEVIFYGLICQGLPANWSILATKQEEEIQITLKLAFQYNRIPLIEESVIQSAIDLLKQQDFKHKETELIQLITAVYPELDHDQIVQRYQSYTGTTEGFLKSITQDSNSSVVISEEDVNFAIQFNDISSKNLSLLSEVQKQKANGETSVQTVAKLDLSQWNQLIHQSLEQGGVLPENLSGETQEEKITSYAIQLSQKLEELYPNAFIAYKLLQVPTIKYKYRNKSKQKAALDQEAKLFPELNMAKMEAKAKKTGEFQNPIRTKLAQFFDGAKDFDLQTTVIDDYIEKQTTNLFVKTDKHTETAVINRLKAFQRVAQVTPQFDQFHTLLLEGYDSAFRIQDTSEQVFIDQFTESLGEEQAKKIYANAEQLTATITHLFTSVHQTINDVAPAAMDRSEPVASLVTEFPNWSTLFGRMDLCECAHCRSVYSPAAYLVDLLQFIPLTARSYLTQRRPDLQHIQLTCENTNTTLPFVDLIIEILESYIALGQPTVNNTSENINSNELNMNREYSSTFPESISNQVYQKVGNAVYPFSLPYHKHLQSIRAYLRQIGTSRHELMEMFPGTSMAMDRMGEYLGLSTKDIEIWLGKTDIPIPNFYGYDNIDGHGIAGYYYDTYLLSGTPKLIRVDQTIQFNWGQSAPDPSMPVDFSARWIGKLVPQVSDTYTFHTRADDGCRLWIDNQLMIDDWEHHAATDRSSSPIYLEAGRAYQFKLEFYDFGSFGEMGCFWSSANIPKTRLGDEVLRYSVIPEQNFSKVPEFLSRTGLSYEELLELLTTRYINPDPNNPQVKLQVQDDLCDLDKINITGLFANSYSALYRIHRFIRLQSKLGLTITEFDKLYSALGGTDEMFLINFAEMKKLHAEIGKKTSLIEMLSLWFQLDKRGENSLYFATFQNKAISNPPDSDFQLNADGTEVVGKDKSLISKLSSLLAMLQITAEEFQLISKDASLIGAKLSLATLSILYRYIFLARQLGVSIEEFIVVKQLISSKPFQSPGQTRQFIKQFHTIQESEFSISLLQHLFLDETKPEVQAPITSLITALKKSLESGFEQISNDTQSTPEEESEQKRLLVIRNISDKFGITETMSSWLVEENLRSNYDPSKYMLQDFLTPVQEEAFFVSGRRLHKTVQLLQRFSLSIDESKYLTTHSADFEQLDFNLLPINTKPIVSQITKLFLQWTRLQEFVGMKKHLLSSDYTWLDLFQEARKTGATLSGVLDKLAFLTGWNRNDLGIICGSNASNLQPVHFINAAKLAEVKENIFLLKRLKVSADQVQSWVISLPNPTIAASIKETVKSRYDSETWLRVAAPIEDQLREQQRKALIAYTLQIPVIRDAGISNSNELFEYFLIDVDMGPCMKTSRIKQAISSTQLFVQRVLLNLESEVEPYFINRKKWDWMKTYRIWEANRKVFLYPENWIEPELRGDKTPLFKDLETELIQNEITTENTEEYLQNYLQKLGDISHLDILSTFYLRNYYFPSKDIVHVIARTYSKPYVYHHRVKKNDVWSPWEMLDLDIDGDHLIPILYNNRLYLFWAMFEKEVDPASKKPTQGNQGNSPKEYIVVKLAWSEFRKGQWTAKKVSTQNLKLPSEIVSETDPDQQRLGYRFQANAEVSATVNRIYFKMKRDIAPEGVPGLFKIIELGNFIFYPDEKVEVISTQSSYNNIRMINTHYSGMKIEANADNQPLTLSEWDPYSNPPIIPTKYLEKLNGKFRVVPLHQDQDFAVMKHNSTPFFVQDRARTYYANSSTDWLLDYQFTTYFHPFVYQFLSAVKGSGSTALYTRYTQELTNDQFNANVFQKNYLPTALVRNDYPKENVDFTNSGAYSIYNWELFFHIPMMVAMRFSREQRFEEAQNWFHYIFNPTDGIAGYPSSQYWQFKPFREQTEEERIWKMLRALADPNGDPELKQELQSQIAQWRESPFQPHQIARMRWGAYKKNVVMKYIDNLIAWGDHLFAQDTLETINEATQIYVLAAHLLGPRPEQIPELVKPAAKTYAELVLQGLDDFSNVLVDIQNRFPYISSSGATASGNGSAIASLTIGKSLYFGIPKNEELLKYWDRVEDRLFKIRHCLNIDGVARTLALFEPPIDPALVVKAVASGLDLGTVLTDINNASVGHYRFQTLLSKALEICAEVKSIGNALLSALEKKDIEEISNLRAGQETSIQRLIRQVKEQQIEEAKASIESVAKTKATVEYRSNYYKNLEFTNTFEKAHLDLSNKATVYQILGQIPELAASVAAAIPEIDVGASGWAGTPVFKVRYGGSNISAAFGAFSRFMNVLSTVASSKASMSATMGGHKRRAEEWKFQGDLADRELKQIEKQILAAEIRKSITERELKNHDAQIENLQTVERFLRDKYTNHELYQWMVSQISSLYFQAYQLAYQVAKKAEKAYQFERGITTSNFIQFGHWDSLKKGLLAGERLYLDLKRLEMDYFDQNAREYELSKQISLVHLDPMALVALRTTGKCSIHLPEALFDMDHPGHYMRRIKSVSITIPCVTGPYTGVNGKLILESSKIRINNVATDYEEQRDEDFIPDYRTVQKIATSTAQNDTGMFELNFRDDRYLPFEGSGVISKWKLELPKETNAFDFDTISDVVIKLNYTAREGGDGLREAALQAAILPEMPSQGSSLDLPASPEQKHLYRLFSIKHEFSNDWRRFMYPSTTAVKQECVLTLNPERFPYRYRGQMLKIEKIEALLQLKDGVKYPNNHEELTFTVYQPNSSVGQTVPLHVDENFMDGIPNGAVQAGGVAITQEGNWKWEVSQDNIQSLDPSLYQTVTINGQTYYHLNPEIIEDLLMVVHFKAE
jgi:hypothetical protein